MSTVEMSLLVPASSGKFDEHKNCAPDKQKHKTSRTKNNSIVNGCTATKFLCILQYNKLKIFNETISVSTYIWSKCSRDHYIGISR